MERRRFNGRERTALYLAAGGRCDGCGVELEPGWHGDHVQPYSRGGRTDVINGQALCPPCNLKKGSAVTLAPRGWQRRFIAKYHANSGPDFLCVACPGAGKTLASAFVTRDLFASGEIDRVLIVVPTVALRMQWHHAFAKVGILLDGWTMNNGRGEMPSIDGKRIQGWVIAYQSLDAAPETHRILNDKSRTLAILDEVHHLSKKGKWGTSAIDALTPCVRRLSLSGTPFRGDKDEMPFVEYLPVDGINLCRYKDDPEHKPFPYPRGFDYSYGTALTEKPSPVRPAVFETYPGDVAWLEPGQSEECEVNISDESLSQEMRRKANRHVLNAAGDWLGDILEAANRRLSLVRSEGDNDAKGLVVCMDTDHAREVAKNLRMLTQPDLVEIAVYRDETGKVVAEEARETIERFGAGPARWLVAVAMVSEGVDIPQLRVGVYATTVRSELFFRQVLGRFVRMRDDLPDEVDQTAYLFVPKEPLALALADNVQGEVKNALISDSDENEDAPRGRESSDRQPELPFDSFQRSASQDPSILMPGRGLVDPVEAEQIAADSGRPVAVVVDILLRAEQLRASRLGETSQSAARAEAAAPATQDHTSSYPARLKKKRAELERVLKQTTGAILRKNGGEFADVIRNLKNRVYVDAGIYHTDYDKKEYDRADLPQIEDAVRIVKKLWSDL